MVPAMTRASLTVAALVLVAPALVAACGGSDRAVAPPAPPAAPAVPAPPPPVVTTNLTGVDTALMDRAKVPGADFYGYANGTWMRDTVIPADRNSASSFAEVTLRVEAQTHELLDAAAAGTLQEREKTPSARQAADVYASFLDEAKVDSLGMKPLAPTLARITRIADKRALSAELGAQLRADVDILNHTKLDTRRIFGVWVEQDLNDPRRQVPYLLQGGLGMPDRKYYLDSSPKMVKTRERYRQHLATLLKLAGVAEPEAKARRVMELETKIAEVHASRAETSETKKGNNPWKRADFAAKAPGIDWKAYFHAAGLEQQEDFVVWQPGAFTGVGALVASVPLSTWKEYLTVQALDMAAPYLAKPFADEDFAFQQTELKGVPEMRARWKRAIDAATLAVPDAVGRLYVGRHFRAEDKRKMQDMVAGIIDAFDHRIEKLAWMAPETKARAREKLKALYVGVGYPDTWEEYPFAIVRDDLFGNIERAAMARYRASIAKLSRPADKKEWCMEAQLVNAVNLPVRNSLNFPAAILQPPFFRPGATPAVNFGAIGVVIGHEISHSFDNEGALFDARGKFENWWTPEDLAHFQASSKALAEQYGTYQPFPDLAVNGEQTLSENIADLAGLSASHDAWLASLGGQPAPAVDGFSGEQQFFLGYGQNWKTKMREATYRQRLVADGHAPGEFRAVTVRNVDAWYPAFAVKPGEALYLTPEARVRVW
jgi:putative endopeptidase